MPYRRITILRTEVVAWEQIALEHAVPRWGPLHRPESTRLLLPLENSLIVELGGERFVVDAGAGLWLTPRHSYRVRQPHADQRSLIFTIHAEDDRARRCRLTPLHHLRLHHLRALTDKGQALEAETGAAELVEEILSQPPARLAPHRAVESAREFIASDPTRNDDLATIARAATCSPFHLARQFRRQTGRSLCAFRDDLRMTLALQRLQGGEQDLAHMAIDLGYSHQSHFGSAFNRRFGVAPGQMRRILISPGR